MKSIIKKFIPAFILSWYYSFWPFLGFLFYRNPSRKITVIGITGTNGKTTVTHLATQILEDAGYKVASISSLRFKIGSREWTNDLKMTMPGRMRIQQFLRDAVRADCRYVVMEVTSEGIKQKRHLYIQFDTAVFTNLTPEHIESHGSFEKYRRAKGEFFAIPHRTSIVNFDDENAEYFLGFDAAQKIVYSAAASEGGGINSYDSVLAASRVSLGSADISFDVGNVGFRVPLLGQFNVANTLAALSVGLAQGLGLASMQLSLTQARGIPGRMEVMSEKPFRVIVDYAHTPDALQKVYQTLGHSRLVCVLGAAGGGRDVWKRPELGRIAAQHCGRIILTDEDPYDENPASILQEVAAGIADKQTMTTILDRREAIGAALDAAEDGDTVIITGKGAEPWLMGAHGTRIAWDDRKVVREELKALLSTHT